MGKTLSVNVDHKYESGRGEVESVRDALAWLERNGYEMTPGDLIVYAARRIRALHKDRARVGKGRLASRIYAPRVEHVTNAPRKLVALVESVHETGGKLANGTKPEPHKPAVKRKASKPAPVKTNGNGKRNGNGGHKP